MLIGDLIGVIASVALIIASIAWLIVSFCLVNGLVERGNALKLVYCAVYGSICVIGMRYYI
ncbi:hypothetical protein BTR22_16965 [Alkalihalophilus pseudofirmus]|uniref:hypothetical protein n=1 Tax=Alkalihalophilus pseudofirmus TaxID=79885 RepID=UPI000952ACFF|nr:hypothetical protein BTR22_16965 [Alkalihalophilus pseudofirmus]